MASRSDLRIAEPPRPTSSRAVEKHISNIFSKLGLPPSGSGHHRVLAVLACPES